MIPSTPSPRDGSPTELLRLARDALRRVPPPPGEPPTGRSVPALVERLGLLSDLVVGMTEVLEATRDELWRRERAGAVAAPDGVFVGDPHAALVAMDLWADRAQAGASFVRQAVDNAHVAAGGLAEPVGRPAPGCPADRWRPAAGR